MTYIKQFLPPEFQMGTVTKGYDARLANAGATLC